MAVSSDAEIVVIGCGISGLSAAHKLIQSGFDKVRIFEATSRSGGRIKTANIGNVITEIGASYIHGASEQNPVFCLSLDYGLLDPEASLPENMAMEVDERPPFIPNYFRSSGERLSAEKMKPALDLFNELREDCNDLPNYEEKPWPSIGHFLKSEARKRAAERWKHEDKTTQKLLMCVINAILKEECTSSATPSMDNIDIEGFCMYKSLAGLDCTFPGGFEGLVEKLMAELPADLVSYNRPVRCIHWNNTEDRVDAVTVECDDGEKIAADHVIVTVSLGYLKKLHSTLFSPPLPAHKLLSIHKLGYGTLNKIFVEFDCPWWNDDCEIIYLVWDDEEDMVDHVSDLEKSWIRKLSSFTVLKHPKTETYQKNSHVLCGWIAGQEAEHMETLTEQQLRQALVGLFHTFTGDPSITPKRILRTQWFSDPWACGSFCHPATGFTADDLKNMAEPLPTTEVQSQPLQVLFAGEATHPEAFSSVHGALLSGWREADRLINHYASFSSSSQQDKQKKTNTSPVTGGTL